jgi:hypothetical protein
MRTHTNGRRSKARPLQIWLGLCVALVLGLASCSAIQPDNASTRLPDDGPSPPVSRSAALSFVQKTLTAGQSAVENGSVTLILTDAELTSFLNIRTELTRELQGVGMDQLGQIEGLQELAPDNINVDAWRSLLGANETGSGLRLPRLRLGLRDPRIYFRGNGDVIARGDAALLKWKLPIRVVVAPYADEGELSLDFVEGQVGPVQVPEFLFDLLGKGLATALLAGQEYAEITRIQVISGALTLSGRYNR